MRTTLLCLLFLFSCAPKSTEHRQPIHAAEQPAGLRAHVVPGMTFGNVALQRQTISMAFDVVAKAALRDGCSGTHMSVSDTWPVNKPEVSEYSDAFLRWTELWTYEVCGQNITVAVVYMLHKETGKVSVSVSPLEEGKALEIS